MKENKENIFDSYPMYLKVSQVAKIMGVPDARVYALIHEGSIPYTKLGSMRVQKYDLRKWLQEHSEYGVIF